MKYLKKFNESARELVELRNELKTFCDENNVILLRTIGVIFSDEEKRISDYIG